MVQNSVRSAYTSGGKEDCVSSAEIHARVLSWTPGREDGTELHNGDVVDSGAGEGLRHPLPGPHQADRMCHKVNTIDPLIAALSDPSEAMESTACRMVQTFIFHCVIFLPWLLFEQCYLCIHSTAHISHNLYFHCIFKYLSFIFDHFFREILNINTGLGYDQPEKKR